MSQTIGKSGAALLLLVLAFAPGAASAQLGGLKKVLKKDEPAKTSNQKLPTTQWTEGEIGERSTVTGLDQLIRDWKAMLEYNALPEKVRAQREGEYAARQRQLEAKSEQRQKCVDSAMTPEIGMQLSQRMQARMLELAKTGEG